MGRSRSIIRNQLGFTEICAISVTLLENQRQLWRDLMTMLGLVTSSHMTDPLEILSIRHGNTRPHLAE